MDEFAQVVFYNNGQRYRMAMPDIVHVHPISFNMRNAVHVFYQMTAAARPIKYVVDVGACVGTFAIPISMTFPDAEILCIEPSKYNYPFLEFNVKPLEKIRSLKIAAHRKRDTVRISAPTIVQRSAADGETDTGLISIYGEDTQFAEMVPAERLDNIVDKPVDWLKIDVEGHEIAVLDGAKRILAEDRPILQVEFREENQRMAQASGARLMLEITKHNYVPAGSVRGDILFRPGVEL